MKKKLLYWLFYLILVNQSWAQVSLPPVYEIKSDTAELQQLPGNYWHILEDKSGRLTFEQVLTQPIQDQFHDGTSKIDTTVNTYWLRYMLKNVMKREARISIDCYQEFMDSYLSSMNGPWRHFTGGLFQDWDKKDGLKRVDAMPQTLEPEEVITVYQRIHNKKERLTQDFEVVILGTDSFVKKYYIDYVDSRTNYFGKTEMQEAFLLGLLLLTIFLNLFFFRIAREKEYLYFALFVLSLAVNRLWNISMAYCIWGHPTWQELIPHLGYAWAFIPFFLIQFFRHFLKTKVIYPRWDKLLIALGVLNIILGTFFEISRFPAIKPYTSSLPFVIKVITALPTAYFLIPLSILITLSLYVRKNENSVRYITLGASPFLLLYVGTQIYTFFGHPMPGNFRLLEVMCISWLVISFTLILMMQFDLLRKENARRALDNEKLQREKEIEKNILIAKQKEELEIQVAERTLNLNQTLENLKATQAQLIQSEKLASLGELTAGIAHEIQNPLNFVNNFSELSVDLAGELKLEMEKLEISEKDKDYVGEIVNDLAQNQEKINHHGKRASSIVKGMLEHSRTSTGAKEPTDINALAEEYLRLAYHGLRAKDNSFNATLKTDFDPAIGKVSVVSQDIGRVLLNLVNNAFYAVAERRRLLLLTPPGFGTPAGLEEEVAAAYEPTVTVSTKKIGDKIEIRVADNGNGIPQEVKDKIFQPFFTTKPTGQGTGLGLSLAYDIVTKGHGGTLEVETEAGKGSKFVINLPDIETVSA